MNELAVFLLAAIPVFEVRGAVPLGIAVYKLAPPTVVLLSILGSILPIFPLLWFLENITEHLEKIPVFNNFLQWLFTRTRSKSGLIKEMELIGLTIFIAIPFPGTGVWTGTIAAYLLGLRWGPTFFAGFIGTTIASILVAAATLGVINFIL
ncbi:MAG: small multi-drug export protein [Candidatus Margulisbacteria bacterium]|nr:small multi-drug export protein [Candidatus Margulisiibacteriota bacterium]MBU1617426.1 small multi-drug export protein [Candidatus Margulisiibacteriota bacterium]MBU1867033.1 small multi-drug export protein [Candidatus Margulisiibacteriota bacterium]